MPSNNERTAPSSGGMHSVSHSNTNMGRNPKPKKVKSTLKVKDRTATSTPQGVRMPRRPER